ncbi:helix-turn-helix domain-containing protein [Ferribacterium limneticum]|uniref:helix-turn-helix domain-containing protein n=1 Tax=Ferribacterium limneticum TaxID=76259 RepID=UPI001CF88197|nr:helix-turn-helix domain-containing protein [Ferribacterium limneticum]UCV23589.1 helix-turn-helix domain-containing protein [Ferribacterium limneticum]
MRRPFPDTVIHTPQQAGAYLRDRRKALKLSQTQVATRLGVSQNRFSVLEAVPGDLTLERLLVLAKTLGLELVLRSPEPPANTSNTTENW